MIGWHVKKLKDNCLDVIKKNIDYFVLVFESGDVIPKRHLEYLQRSSSQILLNAQEERRDLSLVHANFFINPYLKDLDLYYFSPDDINAIIEKLKNTENNINCLCLTGEHFAEEIIFELVDSSPQTLTSLLIWNTVCSDEVLRRLAIKCPVLQSLDVSQCPNVTDAGLEALCTDGNKCENTTLRKLKINDTAVSRSGIAFALEHFRNLEELEHDLLPDVIYEMNAEYFLNGNISKIKKYNLTELYIDRDNQSFLDTLKICCIACPHVTAAHIGDILTETELLVLVELSELKIVRLSFEQPISILSLLEKKGGDLEELEVISGSVSLEQIVKFCPKLQYLRLRSTEIQQTNVPSLCDFDNTLPDLQEITITNVNFDEIAEPAHLIFSSCPNVERLDLSGTLSVTNEFVRMLTKCKFMSTLQELYIGGTDVTISGVRELIVVAPNLKELDIGNTAVTLEEHDGLTMIGNYLTIWWSPRNE